MHRRTLLALVVAALPVAASRPVHAQAWPTQPVKIVVPAPAGSSLDIVVRLMSDKLKERWGQPVVVENKAGAGGMLGTDVAAKAAPDGHTMVLSFNGPISFAPFMYAKMPYDPAKDLLPVVMTTSQPNVLAVNANVPAANVKEFVAWAKAKPGGMNYSSLGKGSSSHLSMELFLADAGVAGTHVPYNGSPPSAMAVAQGEVDAAMMVAPAMLPHVQAGRVKLLAVTSAQRPDSLKSLPTMAEAGYPNVEALAWNGLFVPAGTPAAVVERINADVNAVLRDADVRAKLDGAGMTPVGGTAAEFRAAVAADTQRWGAIINRIGLKIE
ncbi:MAG: tripartite tricarboxylate transporter substrate binding protein [Burkholderiaceae bacterium]|nr:tripartite tricarboxylate transporter substrate binding protein [Burkholderiaceae bacterium]